MALAERLRNIGVGQIVVGQIQASACLGWIRGEGSLVLVKRFRLVLSIENARPNDMRAKRIGVVSQQLSVVSTAQLFENLPTQYLNGRDSIGREGAAGQDFFRAFQVVIPKMGRCNQVSRQPVVRRCRNSIITPSRANSFCSTICTTMPR